MKIDIGHCWEHDEINGDRQKETMTIRSAARGKITSVYAASHVYYELL